MNEQVLTIEQMQELIALGIDTSKASMCWFPMMELDENMKLVVKSHFIGVNGIDFDSYWNTIEGQNTIRTFTLQDILSLLPYSISTTHPSYLSILPLRDGGWYIRYSRMECDEKSTDGKTLLQAAFNMLKWCKQNNYI